MRIESWSVAVVPPRVIPHAGCQMSLRSLCKSSRSPHLTDIIYIVSLFFLFFTISLTNMRSRRSQKTRVRGNGAIETTFRVEGSLHIAYECARLTWSFFFILPELQTPAASSQADVPDSPQDSPTSNPPVTPDRTIPVTPQRRERRLSFKARELGDAYDQLFHDSPTLRNRRRRTPSNKRKRRIRFASVDSRQSSPSPSTQPSTAPPSPISSSHERLPPESESGQSQSGRSRTPSPAPERSRVGPAGNRTRHAAKDIWAFYVEISSKRNCTFCRYALAHSFIFV